MELITSSKKLEQEFRRLIESYEQFNWSVAWANSASPLFKTLVENEHKIRKIVVGIHFYQTDPDFIMAFMSDDRVRFIQQPNGTFHPKLYLFSNSPHEWELLIGSANFTNGAITKNIEASMLISYKEKNSAIFFDKALNFTAENWSNGKGFTEQELDAYRRMWELKKPKLNSLSDNYGEIKLKVNQPIFKSPVAIRTWRAFFTEVEKEGHERLRIRLRVIEIAHDLFQKVNHFNELDIEERKFIAGLPNKLDLEGAEYAAYFGSMKGAGKFKNRINENDPFISKALDHIPLHGQITKRQFLNYVKDFKQTLPGNYIATATRLLCIKRPDIFICFDSQNQKALCEDFNISKSQMDFSRYWDDIIERIFDCNWWQNPTPETETQSKVSAARAAFLDSLYYIG